ncbi:MAG TPA: CopD family protein [Anaerolineales bacterium]|nr:CopD family protein [Cellvibrionaceae bacterium]HMZ08204.1 CopD family protein [Anaerolineales bacterium]HNA88627.1 CopD family protein [Anaerolineales bacterium]HNB35516.1 CopD family protein [Anaerolineales bacterium]HNC07717.1 CopD family protein [Anaerolineales bacterium]
MDAPSTPVLAVIYWLHLLATVTWIGSLAAINLLFLPASKRTLKLPDQLSLISALQKRLEPLAWFCMGILLVTGLFQLSTSPHYNGFLDISTQWSLAILVKHGLAVLMVVVSAMQTWEVLPAIQRILMKKETANEAELKKLQKKETLLLQLNLLLSALILGATAYARVS